MEIHALNATYIESYGNGYACQSIMSSIHLAGRGGNMYCVSADAEVQASYCRLTIPAWGGAVGYRIFSEPQLIRFTEWRYQKSLSDECVAYLWPPFSLTLVEKIKQRDIVVALESINTHQMLAKSILDDEYHRLGMDPVHGIEQKDIEGEQARIEMADYIFCPSDEVVQSMLFAGVPEKKLIRSSYGLDQKDIMPEADIAARNHRGSVTGVFVGQLCIRKGVHLLLESWVKADVKGVLRLIGNIDEDARCLIEPFLRLPNIVHIPFTSDLSSVYRDADVFLFPSLEEGSPLVTYLALGAGLPSIVSSMGGGGIIRHKQEGLVIDPHDIDGWVDAIRQLFFDAALRQRLGKSAYARAPYYLWNKVGLRRMELLDERLSQKELI